MRANEEILQHWRIRINNVIITMDERGRSNEGDNSQMLWNSEWDYVRNELFEVMEAMNDYINISGMGDE